MIHRLHLPVTLLAVMLIFLSMFGVAVADNHGVGIGVGGTPPGHGGTPPGHGGTPPGAIKAPEIDAGVGFQAITLVSGVVLLVAEGSRRRRRG